MSNKKCKSCNVLFASYQGFATHACQNPNKNRKLLEDFTGYCEENPEQRFWQALRNWMGVAKVYVAREEGEIGSITEDTFYWESKDGK